MASVSDDRLRNHTELNLLLWKRLLLGKAKLKASSRTSALLSGFAMVAMVEIELGPQTSEALLISFSVITTLVVAVHLLALMISTCILPHIEAVGDVHHFGAVTDSPHTHLHWYIELAWIFSTGVGILLFLAQMAILVWVRFYDLSNSAHIASTAIIVPVLLVFIAFAIHFYRRLVSIKYESSTKGLAEVEKMALDLESNKTNEETAWYYTMPLLESWKKSTGHSKKCSISENHSSVIEV